MKIGLALSGGVVRGAVHIGVLAALKDANIPIHCIAGASAGSIVGGLYCAGLSLEQMRHFSMEMSWLKVAKPALPGRGFVSFAPLESLINQYVDGIHMEQLHTPCAIVSTDMNSGQPYVFKTGSLATAVRASSSIPGVVTPVEKDGRILCDGGASNNCPVDTVREMGADYVIAVDLFAPTKPKWGPVGMWITSLETLIRSSGGGIKTADCLITPDLSGKSYFRFSKTDEYIELGRQATQTHLDKIKQETSTHPASPPK